MIRQPTKNTTATPMAKKPKIIRNLVGCDGSKTTRRRPCRPACCVWNKSAVLRLYCRCDAREAFYYFVRWTDYLCSEVVLNCRYLFCAIALVLSATDASAESGVASVYSMESGSKTASGQRLNPGALTAAHRSLPFGTKVLVSNRKNGRSVLVTINDRGPFVRGRIIDVTPAAAIALGFSGLAQVSLLIQ